MPTSKSSARKWASCRTKIDAVDGWELDRTIEIAMDALRCPPGDAKVDNFQAAKSAAWRFAACC
jgi:hypothetical protein